MPAAETPPTPQVFIAEFRSLILATTDQDGTPLSSYAPFVRLERHFYIFVSRLAQHTQNLLEQPQVHVMWLRDESAAANVFARQRLSVGCSAIAIDRQSDEFESAMRAFRNSFGTVVDTLKSLPDFVLFRLEVIWPANWVTGFGKAEQVTL